MKRCFVIVLIFCCLCTYAVSAVDANDQQAEVSLRELLKTANQDLLADILVPEHFHQSMEGVELEGQPMLLVYSLDLMSYIDQPYEQTVSYARSEASAEVHILRAKPVVLMEYQNKTALGVNTAQYPQTPTFVKDVMYGSSVQTFFGERCTIENVICFTYRTTRQETMAVYETDKGKFVLYYEDNDASAVVFRWERFAEFAKGYKKYLKWYHIQHPMTDGEILKFMDYCEAPEKYVTVERWLFLAAMILGAGVIAFCGYKICKRKRKKNA